MNIDEQMQAITEELISENGYRYRISRQGLCELVHARFGTNLDSIIPSDYCYNRVNKGVDFIKRPRLFAHVDHGVYECLGENYLYDGFVYAEPKSLKNKIVVGAWENGIFTSNENWERYCFK